MRTEEYELIRSLAARPAMYVGEHRLENIRAFLNGFFSYKTAVLKDQSGWAIDYDLQRWLFLRESASIAHGASISGWELMKRCYGDGKAACEQFHNFTQQAPFSGCGEFDNADTAAAHIYQIYSHYRWDSRVWDDHFNPQISGRFYPVCQELLDLIGEQEPTYEGILPLVRPMIREPHKRVLVYLQYEQYFQQVRFLYEREQGGWVDSAGLAQQSGCYEQLIVLHAYAALAQKEEHPNHIVEIRAAGQAVFVDSREITDYFNAIFNHGADIGLCNRAPMSAMFSDWKEKRTLQ